MKSGERKIVRPLCRLWGGAVRRIRSEQRILVRMPFCYPLKAYLNKTDSLGFWPLVSINALNIRDPRYTEKIVNKTTPIRPTTGCQAGMLTGVACLISISIGVKGGNRDNPVEKLLNGSFNTGIITNMGNKTGSMAGN